MTCGRSSAHPVDGRPLGQAMDPPPASEAARRTRLQDWARADWRTLQQRWPALAPLPCPAVALFHRGSALGRAWPKAHRIGLNGVLLAQPEGWREARDTVAHELAHLAAWRVFGDRAHGVGWKRVMAALGVAPTRTHALDVRGVPGTQRRWRYRCACATHHITTTRHNRIRQGRMRYHCRHCGTALARDTEG